MGSKELSYSDAVKRLDEILEDIDQSRVPIDVLAERVVEAAALLKRCKSVLTETEAKVQDVLEGLEKDFGGEEAGED
ncbi:MAG TPA: exodeoxyribonuclease VII small subunit [Fibrobacteres bacterium]|jgi:exodeoxyribonuclease VII small subunit|nr:exodeoxyribonuclease VII small subunit [Fibrobacterota bacterium]